MNETFRNPKEAFDDAIKMERLSINPNDENYAGKYMYMGTYNNVDEFKNIITREYLVR